MGKWHRPSQVGLIIKKICNDVSIESLYKYELNIGWTDCVDKWSYWTNTKERILKLTGSSIYRFIPSNTINYIGSLNKVRNEFMKKNKKKYTEDNVLDSFDKEDLILIIKGMKKRLDEIEKEKSKHEKIKNKCLTYQQIDNEFKSNKRRIYKSRICIFLNLERRTLNNNKLKIFIDKKPRKNSIVHNVMFAVKIHQIYELNKNCAGHRKIHKFLQRQGIICCEKTVNNAMKQYCLYASSWKKSKKLYEQKDTRVNNNYLLNNEQIKNYKHGQVYSIDFSQIETKTGPMWMHGAIDVISKKILFIDLVKNQNSWTVIKSFKKLPNSTKIINTDHGASYLSKETQEFLNTKKIQHSLGIPGMSYHNRWIEELWKRIKYEWFTQYPTNKLDELRIKGLIDEYINYFNNIRINSVLFWKSPNEYERNFL